MDQGQRWPLVRAPVYVRGFSRRPGRCRRVQGAGHSGPGGRVRRYHPSLFRRGDRRHPGHIIDLRMNCDYCGHPGPHPSVGTKAEAEAIAQTARPVERRRGKNGTPTSEPVLRVESDAWGRPNTRREGGTYRTARYPSRKPWATPPAGDTASGRHGLAVSRAGSRRSRPSRSS